MDFAPSTKRRRVFTKAQFCARAGGATVNSFGAPRLGPAESEASGTSWRSAR
jgi:hypothetical protein